MTAHDLSKKSLRERAEALLSVQPEDLDSMDPVKLRQVLHELHVHQIELDIQNEELRNTQKTLADTRNRYMRLYHNAPVGYVVLDRVGVIKKANNTFADMMRMETGHLNGKALAALMAPENETIFRSRLKAFFKNPGGKHMDVEFISRKGKSFYGSIRAVASADNTPRENPADELLLTISDITERKKLETQLRHAQKMEAISTLAGGIAHDYNNLLSAILGNIELIQDNKSLPPDVKGFLNQAENAAYKARDLTHELMILSKGGMPVKEVASLSGILNRLKEQNARHTGITLDVRVQKDLWPVAHNPKQIAGALQNIIDNAIDAMAGNGTITLRAKNTTFEEESELPDLRMNPGDYVKISIKDHGPGIAEQNLSQAFDPYFTTKEMGPQKGMGLGLATAYAVIQKHEGYIALNSQMGEGTEGTIYLPASTQTEAPPSATPEPDKIVPRRYNILIMDDEEMLRTLTGLMLKKLNCKTLAVKNGSQAIAAYRDAMDKGDPFDAVILDLTIKGGMGGREVIRELIKMNPQVKAIVCSGYFNDPVMADYKSYGFQASLSKPFRTEDLEKVLKKVVQR